MIPDKQDPGYKKYNNEPEQQIQQELAEGIMTAVRDHVQVISMSIGYSAPSGAVRAALQYAYHHGIVLVASSGNSGDNDTQHAGPQPRLGAGVVPGRVPRRAERGRGQHRRAADVVLKRQPLRPGRRARQGGPRPGQERVYYTVNGTSPACALVAGVAALIKSRYPAISPALVMQALTTTAQRARRAATTCSRGSASWTRTRPWPRRDS